MTTKNIEAARELVHHAKDLIEYIEPVIGIMASTSGQVMGFIAQTYDDTEYLDMVCASLRDVSTQLEMCREKSEEVTIALRSAVMALR